MASVPCFQDFFSSSLFLLEEMEIRLKNHIRLFLKKFTVLLLVVGVLTGCVDREQIQQEQQVPNTGLDYDIEKMPELVSENPDHENLADMLQKNGTSMMVQIRVGNRLGSGVIYDIVDDKLVILTAGHVIAGAEAQVEISFCDEYTVCCDTYHISDTVDLGALMVETEKIPIENMQMYRRARVDKERFDSLQKGDGCIAMGCRTGVAAEAYEGKILNTWIYMEDYQQYMLWAEVPGKLGMSGGGLFDRSGNLIGVLSGMSEDGEMAVVPLSFVPAELEKFLMLP